MARQLNGNVLTYVISVSTSNGCDDLTEAQCGATDYADPYHSHYNASSEFVTLLQEMDTINWDDLNHLQPVRRRRSEQGLLQSSIDWARSTTATVARRWPRPGRGRTAASALWAAATTRA